MADFLKDSPPNPAIVPSQKGFLRIFALWILDKDLPWMTGQAPLLNELSVNYQLPSDTTIRNELARIFVDLDGKVVREILVQ